MKIEPQRGHIDFNHVQPPENPAVPRIPTSFLAVAGSGMGKTTAILAALLDKRLYRSCFSRIYVFSGSILEDGRLLDKSWLPLVDYCTDELKIDQTKEQTFYPANPQALMRVVKQWEEMSEIWKDKIKRKAMRNEIRGAAVVMDDVSDNASFARHSAALMTLAVRARHILITPFYSVQKLRTINQAVRVNIRTMWVWRARNSLEKKAIYEEVGAHLTEEEFNKLYDAATSGHDFLNIRLDQPLENMFFRAFESRLEVRRQ